MNVVHERIDRAALEIIEKIGGNTEIDPVRATQYVADVLQRAANDIVAGIKHQHLSEVELELTKVKSELDTMTRARNEAERRHIQECNTRLDVQQENLLLKDELSETRLKLEHQRQRVERVLEGLRHCVSQAQGQLEQV